MRPLARALALYEAARGGDVSRAASLLEDAGVWRGLGAAPPGFVTAALESLVASSAANPIWKRALPPWLAVWGPSYVSDTGARLAAVAGLAPAGGARAEAPPGMPPGPWFLHQAARALGRDDAREALAFVRRALDADAALAEAPAVRDALPELERRARAQALAVVLGPENGSVLSPSLLVDAADLLGALPTAAALLAAADAGSRAAAGAAVAELAEAPDLPPRLAHHLALLEQRTALALDEQRTADAEPHWHRAWGFWLRLLPTLPGPVETPREGEAPLGQESANRRSRQAEEPGAPGSAGASPSLEKPAAGDAVLVIDWLLGVHRRRITDLLARNVVDQARRYWALVQQLPGRASGTPLAVTVAERVARFGEELATEYLLTTREAMRYGDIAEGMHADYEKGLGNLRRLLSLDHDNVRLLTALVEVCDEWFLDLYNAGRPPRLSEQVERFTPFATQLARLIEGKSGELAARAALSDFYKFRGFVSGDRDRKVALYRDALRFNPANQNVRDLLADLGEGADADE